MGLSYESAAVPVSVTEPAGVTLVACISDCDGVKTLGSQQPPFSPSAPLIGVPADVRTLIHVRRKSLRVRVPGQISNLGRRRHMS